MDNICYIFKEYSRWYKATKKANKRWGIPVSVQMAIIHQESRFKAKALPGKKYILFFIPWGRLSSANGYSQAKNETWEAYKKATGRRFASRKNFSHSVDFVGWYLNNSAKELHISKDNAYALYLAYHEGNGGYKRKTYLQKPWLVQVAQKVSARASMYRGQLLRCD